MSPDERPKDSANRGSGRSESFESPASVPISPRCFHLTKSNFDLYVGFGLSSMAVGMATMDKVASRYAPSPKAFLLITLAGSFFVDLANAFIVQAFLAVQMFR